MVFVVLQVHAGGDNNSVPYSSSITIDSVSVNEDNHPVIGWTLITEQEQGYIQIHRQLDDDSYGVVAQVPLDQDQFTDTGANAQIKPYSYYVVARDPDDDNIAVGEQAHQVVFQHNPQADVCEKTLAVSWLPYQVTTAVGEIQPLPSPFDLTHVMLSFDQQDYEEVITLPADTEEFLITADKAGEYCIRVQTIDTGTGVTSTSNTRCLSVNFAPEPEFLHLRKVSLNEESTHVQIVIHADNSVPQPSYVFQRYDPDSLEFVSLDTLQSNEQDLYYEDFETRANQHVEAYRVLALDSCMDQAMATDSVATIFAEVFTLSPNENQVSWNKYSGWENTVDSYILERKIFHEEDFIEIANLPGSQFEFTDELTNYPQSDLQGEILYRVLAIQDESGPFGFQDTVLSNIASVERELEVFIPNAFRPGSSIVENRQFRPRFTYFVPLDYRMQIFNRWGQRVFSTDDESQGWDGMYEGGVAPAGVYSYVISFKDNQGKSHQRKGTVVLAK